MNNMLPMNWLVVYPEALLLIAACAVALVDLYVTDPQRRPTFWLTQISLAAVAGLHFAYYDAGFTVYGMQRMVVTDPMGHLLGGFAALKSAAGANLSEARCSRASSSCCRCSRCSASR